jgi:hypothetical protein
MVTEPRQTRFPTRSCARQVTCSRSWESPRIHSDGLQCGGFKKVKSPLLAFVSKGFFRWSRTYLPTEACGSGPHLYLLVGSLRTLGKFDSKERLLHFLMASPDGLPSVGFVKRSGSPPQTPPTPRPQGLLQTSPTKRTAERTMRAGVSHEDPMLDGGLRGRCARWGVMMRVDWRVTVAW